MKTENTYSDAEVGFDIPALPGMDEREIQTPCLVIDLDRFEINLKKMVDDLRPFNVTLRPHAKMHKSVDVARRQLAFDNTVGICCQKVSEAAAMVAGGIKNVLVTNQIVAPSKLARLCALAKDAEIAVLCDDAAAVTVLSKAARDAGITLNVLVEIEVGAGRCGVDPGEPVATLARLIDAEDGLHFAGLQAYHGSAQHKITAEERRLDIESTIEKVKTSKTALAALGLDRDWVTGAGTGSFPTERDSRHLLLRRVGPQCETQSAEWRHLAATVQQLFAATRNAGWVGAAALLSLPLRSS